VESTQLDIESASFQTQIKGALGTNEGFIGEYVDGLISLFELIQEPMRQAIAATQEKTGLLRSVSDSALQANELVKTLPGGAFIGSAPGQYAAPASSAESIQFKGVHVTSAVDASGEPGLDYVVADGKRGAKFGSLSAGKVIETSTDQNWETNLESNPGGKRGYGNKVIVRSVDEVTGEFVDILYAHLDAVAVQVGQEVSLGTVLGTQGRTGSTTGAHVSVDFFGKDSPTTTPTALAMRDRTAEALAYDVTGMNARVAQPAPRAADTGAVAAAAPQNYFKDFFGVNNEADLARLAVVAITEGLAGNVTSQVDSAVSVANRFQAGMGGDASAIVSAPEQYEAYTRFGLQSVSDLSSAAAALDRNGYSGQSELDNFLAGLQNASQVQSSISHLQGSTDYRAFVPGVTLPARPGDPQRASNDNYYIPGGDSYASISAVQAQANLAQGLALVSQGAQAAAMPAPTTGSNQFTLEQAAVNAEFGLAMSGQINGAQTQLEASVQSQLASLNQLAEFQQRFSQVQARDQERQIIRDGDRALKDEERQNLDSARAIEDLRLDAQPQTLEVEKLRAKIEAARRYRDGADSNDQRLGQLREQLQSSRDAFAVLEDMRSAGAIPEGATGAVEFLGDSIPRLETMLTEAEQNAAEFEAASNVELERIQNQNQNRVESRNAERVEKLGTVDLENLNIELENAQLNPFDIDGIMQAQEALENLKLARQLATDLSEVRDISETDAELAAQLKQRYEELNSVRMGQVQSQLAEQREELERSAEAAQRVARQDVKTSGAAVVDAKATYAERFGFDGAELRRDSAITAQGIEFENGMARVDELTAMGEASGYTAEQIEQLRENIYSLNETRLEDINAQFSPLTEAAQGFNREAQSALVGIITGSKTAGEAFRDFAAYMAQQLAQLAINRMFTSVFGSLLGGGGLGGGLGGSMGGGTMGVIGSITSSLLPGAAKGGVMSGSRFEGINVPNFAAGRAMGPSGGQLGRPMMDGSPFRHGFGGISQALQREGAQGTLAVINENEIVLTPAQAQRFLRSNMAAEVMHGHTPNYANGYAPMSGAQLQSSSNASSITINVPVSVSGEQGGGAQEKTQGLARAVRAAVAGEIAIQKEQGGILYNG